MYESQAPIEGGCPNSGGLIIYNRDDPSEHFPGTCRTWKCLFCGPRKLRQVKRAIGWSADQQPKARLVTLTQAPIDLQQRLDKMRSLGAWARRQGYDWDCAWVTERGSKTGMVHIHAIQHGSFVPQRLLAKRWAHRVDIRLIRGSAASVARYGSKGGAAAASYGSKSAEADYPGWLDLAGGRPWRWSAGYFPEGIKEAIAASAPAKRDDKVWMVAQAREFWSMLAPGEMRKSGYSTT